MKKFFKALALVLALTLVIGSIPVSAAKTDGLSMKKDTKILYIDGSKGTRTDDDKNVVKCKTLSKFTVTKWIKGFDGDTMDLKLKTADKTLVSKNNKYDRVYAKGITTNKKGVDVKLYIYQDGRLIKTFESFKVKVKKNDEADGKVKNETFTCEKLVKALNGKVSVADVKAGNFTAEEIKAAVVAAAKAAEVTSEDYAPVTEDKLGVNVPYFVRLSRKEDGKYTDTDARNLVCLDKDGKPVEDVVIVKLSNTLFMVAFASAGDFTFTAQSYQSKTFPDVIDSENFTLSVGYDALAATQESLDSIRVSFATPVTNIDSKNFRVYSLVNGVEVEFGDAKSATVLKDEDPTAVSVKFFKNFREGTKYYVSYDKQDALEFDTITVDSDSVAAIALKDMVVEAGVPTEIKYQALSKEGVDITASSKVKKKGFVFDITPKNEGASVSQDKQTVKVDKADGKVFTLSVNYTWTSTKDNAKKQLPEPATCTVTAVEAAAWEVGEVKAMLTDVSAKVAYNDKGEVINDVKALEINGAPGFSRSEAKDKVKVQFAVQFTRTNASTGAPVSKYQLGAKADTYKKANSSKKYDDYDVKKDAFAYTGYELESSNKDVLMIGKDFSLIGNKEGDATVLIYGIIDKNNKEVIDTLDVTVWETRKPASFNVTVKNDKDGLNVKNPEDTVTYNLELKDQFGATMTGNVSLTTWNPDNDKASDIVTVKSLNNGTATGTSITVRNTDITWPSSKTDEDYLVANLKFEWKNSNLGDAGVKILALNVSKDNKIEDYRIAINGDKLSTDFKTDSEIKAIDVKLEARNKEGFLVSASGTAINFSATTPEYGVKATNFNVNTFYYTVFKDGAQVKAGDLGKNFADNTFKNFVVSAGAVGVSGTAIKLKAGKYELKLYRVDKIKDGEIEEVTEFNSVTFDVDSAQTALNAVKVDDLTTIDASTIKDAFKITFAGVDDKVVQADAKVIEVNFADDHKSAYVYKILYTVKNGKIGATYDVIADVNTLVEKK